MTINLTDDQEQRLRAWIDQQNAAHWQADAEPPGYQLLIEGIASPWGCEIIAIDGSVRLSLGAPTLSWSAAR